MNAPFRQLNATLTDVTSLTDELKILRFKPDWLIPDFSPGQFTQLGLPESQVIGNIPPELSSSPEAALYIERSYSIASAPEDKQAIEFYLNHVPGGRFTPSLFALEVGDRVWLSERIEGRLTLEHTPVDHHLIWIATGTGLGPFISMLRSAQWKAANHPSTTLIHSVRQADELAYREELERTPNLSYLPIVTRDPTWQGISQRITELWSNRDDLERALPQVSQWAPQDTHLYLCGNPQMVREMTDLLKAQGYDRHHPRRGGHIHMERYW